MKPSSVLTPVEIQRAGWQVLTEQLGLVGALRFLLQYERGEGDYTELRRGLLGHETVEELIRAWKRKKETVGRERRGTRRGKKPS